MFENDKNFFRDEKHYPNPLKFIPERFMGAENQNRHKGVYLSFGDGPRVCPGLKFAIVQIKMAVMHLVKNFHIKLSPNHKPIVINPQAFISATKDGILLQFEKR